MRLPLVLRPEAEQDLVSAQLWYEQQKTGLGDDFVSQTSVVLDRIASKPEMYGTVWADVRACRLRRFPYVVYYRVLAD